MLRLRSCFILSFALANTVLVLVVPRGAGAVTRVSGTLGLDTVFASGETNSPTVFTGGLNVQVIPATRKVHTRFLIPLQFVYAGGETNVEAFPNGIFGADLSGDWYTINLQYGRNVTVNNAAQFTEATTSQIGFSLMPPDLPRLNANYSSSETSSGGSTSQQDTYSLFSTYNYKSLTFNGAYSQSERSSGSTSLGSSFFQFGVSGNYEIVPRTQITGSYDFNSYTSDSASGESSSSLTHAFSMGVSSRPMTWLDLGGTFAKTITTSSAAEITDDQQTTGVNAALLLPGKIQILPSLQSNSFDDRGKKRSVTTFTIGAAYSERLVDYILLGLSASRSYDHDPSQGTNVRDNFGVNALMDITPRISARAVLTVSRQDDSEFVTQRTSDASGTLAQRADFDDRPAGFTFFDTENNDLYTKNSALLGDWSLPVHFEPITAQYSVSKSIQLNMIPTDRTSLLLNYSATSTSDKLDFAQIGSQSVNGSLNYSPNRRTSFSLSGTASKPEGRDLTYSGTATMSHRLLRGPALNLSYSWQSTGTANNVFSTGLTIPFRKKVTMTVSYSSTRFLRDDQSYVLRVGLVKTF